MLNVTVRSSTARIRIQTSRLSGQCSLPLLRHIWIFFLKPDFGKHVQHRVNCRAEHPGPTCLSLSLFDPQLHLYWRKYLPGWTASERISTQCTGNEFLSLLSRGWMQLPPGFQKKPKWSEFRVQPPVCTGGDAASEIWERLGGRW